MLPLIIERCLSFARPSIRLLIRRTTTTIKSTPSTTALPTLSFKHDFGVALWDGRRPITPLNSASSLSPSSIVLLVEKDSSHKMDSPHFTVTSKENPLPPILDPLSSIPISISPRPPPKGKPWWRQQDSCLSAVVDADVTRRC